MSTSINRRGFLRLSVAATGSALAACGSGGGGSGGATNLTLSTWNVPEDIKTYTKSRKMPPWKPADGPAFLGDRRMPEKEIATLAAWVDGGTPEGDPKDAPPPRRFVDGWQLGPPDLVLTVPETFELGAGGSDLYRCFVLPTHFAEDKYVSAVEVRPGSRRVVHHALLFVDKHGRGRRIEEREKQRQRRSRDLGCREARLRADVLPGLLGAGPAGVEPLPRAA